MKVKIRRRSGAYQVEDQAVSGFIRRSKGKFEKGSSGNPTGRPIGIPDYRAQLYEALRNAEAKHGISFIQHFVNKAFVEKDYAMILAKKLLPEMEGESPEYKGAIQIFSGISTDEIRQFISLRSSGERTSPERPL